MIDIEMQDVTSSNIASVGRDAESGTVRVKFNNGTMYDYADVPQEVYGQLIIADSVGKYFNANIKGMYDTTQVA